jgi:hypothetical protein
MRDTHGDLLETIRSEEKLSDESEEKLKEAAENFNSNFEPEQSSLVSASPEDDTEGENGEEEGS